MRFSGQRAHRSNGTYACSLMARTAYASSSRNSDCSRTFTSTCTTQPLDIFLNPSIIQYWTVCLQTRFHERVSSFVSQISNVLSQERQHELCICSFRRSRWQSHHRMCAWVHLARVGAQPSQPLDYRARCVSHPRPGHVWNFDALLIIVICSC